jgi:hypothetical protein
MKQIIAVVLHQKDGAFRVEVRERKAGFYGKWSCQACGASSESTHNFADADEAFENAKQLIALHQCDSGSQSD